MQKHDKNTMEYTSNIVQETSDLDCQLVRPEQVTFSHYPYNQEAGVSVKYSAEVSAVVENGKVRTKKMPVMVLADRKSI